MVGKMIKKSVRGKLLSVIIGVLIITSLVSITIIARNENALLQKSLMDKGFGLGSYMAKLSLDPVLMNDTMQLDAIVNDVIKDEEVAYAVIQNAKGSFLTSRFASINEQAPGLKGILSSLPEDSTLSAIITAAKQEKAAAEISAPIMMESTTLGTVTIGMSEHKIRKQIITTVIFILLVNLVAACVLGAVIFIATRSIILSPITEMIAVSRRVAKGDLSHEADLHSEDELGELGTAMNKMVSDLKNLIGDIRQGATKTASGAEQIAASSRQVRQGASTTSQAAEETLSSMEEMAASIQSVGKNADSLSSNVQKTSGSVTQMMANVENVS
ncbi:MAG TPA: hypothetical protein DCO77_10490, partial [Nitrospiraceae bacterium]|nr:hypothetical protein [Nitrospiraceae bacterium]